MTPTIELVALIQRERERDADSARLARIVARVRDCCRPSRIARMAHALRLAPTAH